MSNLIDIVELEEQEAEIFPVDDVAGLSQGQWTYGAYASLPNDGSRYEIIEGVLYRMTSPKIKHQAINNWIATYLTIYVQMTGLGRVFTAPCDVKLTKDKVKGNVVQPDIIVVLNANADIIKEDKIEGAPDLVVEISSRGTANYDRKVKREAYAKAGVKEYWIVKPVKGTVEVFKLEQSDLVSKQVYSGQDLIVSEVVLHLPIQVAQFFV